MIYELSFDNPIEATVLATINLIAALAVLGLIYYALRPKSRRVTTVYLSGEDESVIKSKSFTPSPLNLYWSFIKRFARTVYGYLVEAMHTGKLSDWVEFMISWYGLLIILSMIALVAYLIAG